MLCGFAGRKKVTKKTERPRMTVRRPLRADGFGGSGGMATKINAAKIATEAGVDMVIMNGRDPEQLYALFDGEPIGTHFMAE